MPNKNSSIKIMLFGIATMVLGGVFASNQTGYFEIIDIALAIFGFIIVLTGLFTRD